MTLLICIDLTIIAMSHNNPPDRAPKNDDELLYVPITDVLDLHTVSPRDTKIAVEEYLIEARLAGFKALRIIHGRGIGVQRELVRKILAETKFVASYRDAPMEAGGWGATTVDLK
ncbi:MAG: Smr/MutS family protein [Acidobacteriota bacterium]